MHRRRALIVGAFDRVLRREAPEREVIADTANLQLDAEFLFDELTHRSAAPQAEHYLVLFPALVDDHALDRVFLRLTEHSPMALAASARHSCDESRRYKIKYTAASRSQRRTHHHPFIDPTTRHHLRDGTRTGREAVIAVFA